MLKSLSRSTPPIPAVQTSLRSAAQFAAARTSHPTPERCSPPCRRGARQTQGGGGGRGGQCFVTIRGLAMENLRCKPAGTVRSRSQPSDSCSEHSRVRRLPSVPTRRRIATAAATMIGRLVGSDNPKLNPRVMTPKMAQNFITRHSGVFTRTVQGIQQKPCARGDAPLCLSLSPPLCSGLNFWSGEPLDPCLRPVRGTLDPRPPVTALSGRSGLSIGTCASCEAWVYSGDSLWIDLIAS